MALGCSEAPHRTTGFTLHQGVWKDKKSFGAKGEGQGAHTCDHISNMIACTIPRTMVRIMALAFLVVSDA